MSFLVRYWLLAATGEKEECATFLSADDGILDNSAPQKREPTPVMGKPYLGGLLLEIEDQSQHARSPG